MSKASYWAARQTTARPLDKLVLLAFADCPGEGAERHPSIAWLQDWTGCDRKTVIKAIASLEAAGLLIDTGRRIGRTRQIKVYALSLETVPETEPLDETVPETAPLNSPVFPAKESQKRDTEPPLEPPPSSKATPSSKDRARATDELKPEHVVEAWNEAADRCRLAKVAQLTPARRRTLDARIREHAQSDFRAAIDCIERNTWMHGENDRGWRVDFDWLLKPANFVRAVEGGFDRAKGSSYRSTSGGLLGAVFDAERHDRRGGWAPLPGMEGREPASLDDSEWSN